MEVPLHLQNVPSLYAPQQLLKLNKILIYLVFTYYLAALVLAEHAGSLVLARELLVAFFEI